MDTQLRSDRILRNLVSLIGEIESQGNVGRQFPAEMQSLRDQSSQLREFVEHAGEYGVAYESIVAMLERFPFVLSGMGAVRLLEVGLLLKYKTGLSADSMFDGREP
jgi:hypothetical protein